MNMDKVGTYQVNACKCKIMKVIWMKVWSRKIPVLIVENSYSEFSTLSLKTLNLELLNCVPFYSQQASGKNIQKNTKRKHNEE